MGLRTASASDEDVSRIAACAKGLAPGPRHDVHNGFVANLFLTVLNTRMHTTTLNKALAFYQRNARADVYDLGTLEDALSRFADDRDGNTRLAQYLWGNNYWTRAERLRRLVRFFRSAGVTDQASLDRWARSAEYQRDFAGQVKGLGYATFQVLAMQSGIDTVKPDIYLRRFTERCVGRPLADSDIVDLVTSAAQRLGIPARSLDLAIWERESGQR